MDRLSPAGEPPRTPEEEASVRTAEAGIAAREAAVAPEDRTPEDRAHAAEQRRLIGEIERGRRLFTDEQKAGGSLVISIDYEGNVRMLACTRQKPRHQKDDAKPAERPLYAASLVEDLSKVRTRALQLEVARSPALALHILIDALLGLATGGTGGHAVQLRAEAFRLEGGEGASAAAIAEPADEVADLLAAMPPGPEARWDWLTALSSADKGRLVAFATARLLNGIAGRSRAVGLPRQERHLQVPLERRARRPLVRPCRRPLGPVATLSEITPAVRAHVELDAAADVLKLDGASTECRGPTPRSKRAAAREPSPAAAASRPRP